MKVNLRKTTLLVSLVAMLTGSVMTAPIAHAEMGSCKTTNASPEAYQAFTAEGFVDSDGDGIPNGFAGWSDYGPSDCHRYIEVQRAQTPLGTWTYRARAMQKIFAPPSGENVSGRASADVSLVRVFKLPTDGTRRFKATAVVDLWSYGGDFRGRLKMVGITDSYTQVGLEYFKDICTSNAVSPSEPTKYDGQPMCQRSDSGSFQTLSVTTPLLPAEATRVVVTWRAHEHSTDAAWGTAALDKLTFTKI